MDIKIRNRISVLGFFMTSVIAIYHCGGSSVPPLNQMDAWLDVTCTKVVENLAGLAMSYFFTTTGFLFFYNFENFHDYIAKMKRRIYSLLIPYLLWQLIYCFPKLLSGNSDVKYIFKTIFLLEAWPPNGPQWYLYVAFALALISPLFYFAFRNSQRGAVICFFISVMSYYMLTTTNPVLQAIIKYGYVINIFKYLPAYVLGLYIGIQENKRTRDSSLKYCVLMLCCALIVDCMLSRFLDYFIYRLLPIFMLYFWPVKKDISKYKLVNFSFLIYSLHIYVDGKVPYRIRNLLLTFFPSAFFENLMGRIISLVVTVIFSIVLWFLLSIICPKLLNYLTGGRIKPYTCRKNR